MDRLATSAMDRPASPSVVAQIANLATSLRARDKFYEERFTGLERAFTEVVATTQQVIRRDRVFVGTPLNDKRELPAADEAGPEAGPAQAESPGPEKRSGVQLAIERVLRRIHGLNQNLDSLEKKLTPVLRVEPPAADTGGGTQRARMASGTSAASGAIDQLAFDLENATIRVAHLTRRLEV